MYKSLLVPFLVADYVHFERKKNVSMPIFIYDITFISPTQPLDLGYKYKVQHMK